MSLRLRRVGPSSQGARGGAGGRTSRGEAGARRHLRRGLFGLPEPYLPPCLGGRCGRWALGRRAPWGPRLRPCRPRRRTSGLRVRGPFSPPAPGKFFRPPAPEPRTGPRTVAPLRSPRLGSVAEAPQRPPTPAGLAWGSRPLAAPLWEHVHSGRVPPGLRTWGPLRRCRGCPPAPLYGGPGRSARVDPVRSLGPRTCGRGEVGVRDGPVKPGTGRSGPE